MATTSTAPTVIDATLTALNADLPSGVDAYEAWPGFGASAEMVVLGETDWEEYEVSTIKAGRQHRTEVYGVGFEVYVMGTSGTTPANPKPARDRAFVLFSSVEDVLADTPDLGVGNGGWIETRQGTAGPRVFEKGWAYRVAGTIHVTARLT